MTITSQIATKNNTSAAPTDVIRPRRSPTSPSQETAVSWRHMRPPIHEILVRNPMKSSDGTFSSGSCRQAELNDLEKPIASASVNQTASMSFFRLQPRTPIVRCTPSPQRGRKRSAYAISNVLVAHDPVGSPPSTTSAEVAFTSSFGESVDLESNRINRKADILHPAEYLSPQGVDNATATLQSLCIQTPGSKSNPANATVLELSTPSSHFGTQQGQNRGSSFTRYSATASPTDSYHYGGSFSSNESFAGPQAQHGILSPPMGTGGGTVTGTPQSASLKRAPLTILSHAPDSAKTSDSGIHVTGNTRPPLPTPTGQRNSDTIECSKTTPATLPCSIHLYHGTPAYNDGVSPMRGDGLDEVSPATKTARRALFASPGGSTLSERTPLPKVVLTPRNGTSGSGNVFPMFPSPMYGDLNPSVLFTPLDTVRTPHTAPALPNEQHTAAHKLAAGESTNSAPSSFIPVRWGQTGDSPSSFLDEEDFAAPRSSCMMAQASVDLSSQSLLLPSDKWDPSLAELENSCPGSNTGSLGDSEDEDEFFLTDPSLVATLKSTNRGAALPVAQPSKHRRLLLPSSTGETISSTMRSLNASTQLSTSSLQGMQFVTSSTSLRAMDTDSRRPSDNYLLSSCRSSDINLCDEANESTNSIGWGIDWLLNGQSEPTHPAPRDLVTPPVMNTARSPPPLLPTSTIGS